jgi:hypothetical protein
MVAMHFEHSTHGLGWHIEAAQLREHVFVRLSLLEKDLPQQAQDFVVWSLMEMPSWFDS